MNEEKLLSPDDVASYLGISRQTVYNYLKQGKLKSRKVGLRAIRISMAEVNQFLEHRGMRKIEQPKQSEPHTPLDVTS